MAERRQCWLPILTPRSLLLVSCCLISLHARLFAQEGAPPEFAKHARPFIEKHCLQCHAGNNPKGDVSLDVYRDETALLKGRKLWDKALKLLANREMPPPKDLEKEKRAAPSAAEIDQFSKTLTAIFDHADRNAKPDPGRVSMRRLNRAEYNNTLRDLLLIHFDASENLPSDEVGHGFDNIGDVQWMSPVLIESYLAAAEYAATHAVSVEPPEPFVTFASPKYLQPPLKPAPDTKFRMISGEQPKSAPHSGPLYSTFTFEAPSTDGEYAFSTRVYAEASAGQMVRVAAFVGGKVPKPASDAELAAFWGPNTLRMKPLQILKVFEIKARSEKDAEVITANIPSGTNFHQVGIALLKPEGNQPVPKLFVHDFSLKGPLDSRPAFQRKYLDCPPGKSRKDHTRDVLTTFASRAFRRPATAAEVDRLVTIVEASEAKGEKWESGIQLAIQSVLISPKFLFRPEFSSRASSAEPQPLGDFELASRLSYFLWSSMPDDTLLELAGKNQLSANIEEQVRRMLKDPKSRALVDNFAMQWLQLRRLANFSADPKLFPEFSKSFAAFMLEETALFINAIIREDRSILQLIDADFTYLNLPLAEHYGIIDDNGNRTLKQTKRDRGLPFGSNQFVRVQLADKERGGLLTHASVLTVTSNPTRTSPVKRGKWVLEQLLGTPPPPPPPDVPDLDDTRVLKGTLRQRMEQHRANPNCASCHARMDPLGFALEHFNAIGKYRTTDENLPIDVTGELPDGTPVNGHLDLKRLLLGKKDQFCRCLTEKLLTYALGRGLEVYDKKSVDRIVDSLSKDGYRFSTLVVEIVKSEPFRLRRGQEETK